MWHELITLTVALGGLLATTTVARAGDGAAAGLRPLISLRHPGIAWIDTATLAEQLNAASGPLPVLLDARTEEEFEVSQIAGARRIEPDDGSLDPLDLPRDTPIVVYCSVGSRSAAVVRRLGQSGFTRVRNLEGGIFQWANERRPVVRAGAPVSVVHPYDAVWGRMLDDSYHPTD